jgi:hypothetical protein
VLGRGGDPIDALAEVDPVQVVGQDLVLAGRPLELGRIHRLGQLAAQAAPVAGDHVLHVLLGDAAAALQEVAAGQVDHGRPGDAAHVQRAVGVEAGILGGQDGVADPGRHGRQRHHRPVLVAVEHGQHRAVGGGDHRPGRRPRQQPAGRRPGPADLVDGRRGPVGGRHQAGQGDAGQEQAGGRHGGDEPEAPPGQPARPRRGSCLPHGR